MLGTPELATWCSFEGANGEWFRINRHEVQSLDFVAQLFDDYEKTLQTDSDLCLGGQIWEMVDFERAPPTAEIGLLVKLLLLENGNTYKVGIADFLVLVDQFGRDMRFNPLAEDLESFADRE